MFIVAFCNRILSLSITRYVCILLDVRMCRKVCVVFEYLAKVLARNEWIMHENESRRFDSIKQISIAQNVFFFSFPMTEYGPFLYRASG